MEGALARTQASKLGNPSSPSARGMRQDAHGMIGRIQPPAGWPKTVLVQHAREDERDAARANPRARIEEEPHGKITANSIEFSKEGTNGWRAPI